MKTSIYLATISILFLSACSSAESDFKKCISSSEKGQSLFRDVRLDECMKENGWKIKDENMTRRSSDNWVKAN